LTVKEEIVAVVETFAVKTLIEDAVKEPELIFNIDRVEAFKEPVLTVKALKKGGAAVTVFAVMPATVEVSCDVEM
jgi:hypothetical protein